MASDEARVERVDPDSEAALVLAAQSGDQAAVEALVERYLPLVHAIASRALDRHADVDDVVQETLVRAVTRLGSLREPDRFRSWIVAIAVRQIRDRMRSLHRRDPEVSWEVLADSPEAAGLDLSDSIVDAVDEAAQRRVLESAIAWLEPDERQVLALWRLELAGFITRDELADGLGLANRHSAVRVHRLRQRLDDVQLVAAALERLPRCPDLALVTADWDGSHTAIWRKRLMRHVRHCHVCGTAARSALPIEQVLAGGLLGAVPVALVAEAARIAATTPVAVPTGLWHQLIPTVTAKPLVAATALAGACAAVILGAVVLPPSDRGTGDPDRPAAPPRAERILPAEVQRTPQPASGTATAAVTRTTTPTGSAAPPSVAGPLIYVAPDGDDAGPGNRARPLATVERAVSVVRAGQTVILREGTYRPTGTIVATTSGTGAQPITLRVESGEQAVLDGSRLPASSDEVTDGQFGTALLDLRAVHWRIDDLEVREAPGPGVVCRSCSDIAFTRLDVHDNAGTGLTLTGEGTARNVIVNSDFHHNHDDATHGEEADGLEIRDGSGAGNVVRGSRVFANADDGLSLWAFGSGVTIESTWAYQNGYNRWEVSGDWAGNGVGFKLGGGDPAAPAAPHVVVNSAAWANRAQGFSNNRNPGPVQLVRNTAYENATEGFWVSSPEGTLERNVAAENRRNTRLEDAVDARGNSWQGSKPDTTEFVSTDPSTAEGPRAADGSLPATRFLVPRRTHAGASMASEPFRNS